MQCGTASRAARDLTGEPCSPVNPFFLDGGLWLGGSPCSYALPFALKAGEPRARNARPYKGTGRLTEGASHTLGGVPGRILASGGQKSFRAPAIFLWYR